MKVNPKTVDIIIVYKPIFSNFPKNSGIAKWDKYIKYEHSPIHLSTLSSLEMEKIVGNIQANNIENIQLNIGNEFEKKYE